MHIGVLSLLEHFLTLLLSEPMRKCTKLTIACTCVRKLTIGSSLPQDGCPDASLTALFTFVARDPLTRKSMAVNPLRPQTLEQRQLFAERQRIADERRAARQQQGSGVGSAGKLQSRHAMIYLQTDSKEPQQAPKHQQLVEERQRIGDERRAAHQQQSGGNGSTGKRTMQPIFHVVDNRWLQSLLAAFVGTQHSHPLCPSPEHACIQSVCFSCPQNSNVPLRTVQMLQGGRRSCWRRRIQCVTSYEAEHLEHCNAPAGAPGWAGELLAEACAAMDLPALATSDAVLMRDTSMQARLQ